MFNFKFFLKKKEEIEIPEPQGIDLKDIIAPPSIHNLPGYLKIGERVARTFFVFSYPRYLTTAWFSSVINLDLPMDIAFFVHPMDTGEVLKQLRKKLTEIQAEIAEKEEKGLVRDPSLEIAYRDIEELRERLQSAQERMFKLGIYLTVYTDEEKQLREIETTLRSILESRLVYIKPALYLQKQGFISTSPLGLDQLFINTEMNTTPLSSTFPFVSYDLSANEGILYGINKHNNSLILFDRFSLENANSVCFGVAGSGKSYAIKLEILRSLMTGAEVIVIDPENEYKFLSDTIGGSFLNISLSSPHHINPFDLPIPREDENLEDVLRSNIINLVGLMRVMLGGLGTEEDAIVDQALSETYAAKDITPDTDPKTWPEKVPLMEDFEAVLKGMEGTESLVNRVGRYTRGTFAQFFNQPTNITMNNPFVVFGIRDMEDELRPIAMFIIMRYIWNVVRSELKKRILVIDEAWWMMRTEDSASFLFGTVKRARKYWLGVTTVTQDVLDFMKSTYGQPIITNSALQILMKQSPAAIETVQKTFSLTDEEKYLLVEAPVGEGLFFAGRKHVAMRVVSSYVEDQIITTAPQEVLRIKKAKEELLKKGKK